MRRAAFAAFLLLTPPSLLTSPVLMSPVWAAEPVWTPAPVPNVGRGDTVLPAARAGDAVRNSHDAPFSAVPTGSIAADGSASPNQVNGVGAPDPSPR